MVFYRKYRPQTISELDIASVRERLTALLQSKEIPHAFLFTGPKGLGKTSGARIVAKAINCETHLEDAKKSRSEDFEPCNTCDTCVSITNGSNIDVIEIDAASNRGIDEIRELRERVKYAPAKAHKKVYIIDEVHMLTNEAFNALLKTLEEPPSHVIFILCTTELSKVPETIVSRTFQVNFELPKEEESIRSIQRILQGEKLTADDQTLHAIYKRAGGSFRDAAKIVEELSIASSGGVLTKELLEKVYSTDTITIGIENLLKALSQKDQELGLGIIQELSLKGVDFKVVIEILLERLREVLIETVTSKGESGMFSVDELENLIDEITESYRRMKFSPIQSLPLEVVVVRFGMNTSQKDSHEKKEIKKEEVVQSVPISKEAKHSSSMEKQDPQPKDEKHEVVKKELESKPKVIDEDGKDHGELFSSLDKNFYDALLHAVKQDNHSIVGVLRGCKLLSLSDDGTVIFQTKYKFHKDKLSENKIRDIIEKRASELLNKKITLQIDLVE